MRQTTWKKFFLKKSERINFPTSTVYAQLPICSYKYHLYSRMAFTAAVVSNFSHPILGTIPDKLAFAAFYHTCSSELKFALILTAKHIKIGFEMKSWSPTRLLTVLFDIDRTSVFLFGRTSLTIRTHDLMA